MVGISDKRSPILAIAILLCQILNCVESITKVSSPITLSSGESEWISAKSPLNNSFTHVWSINTVSSSYVQVTFTDYDLPKESYIKIIDGKPIKSSPSKSYIFDSNHVPVFHSKSRYLTILLKSAPRGRRDSFQYHGVRAKLKAVKYHRDQWEERYIPSSGYCGSIDQHDTTESFVFQPPSKVITRHLFDCIWNIRAKFLQVTQIKLKGSRSSSSGDTLPFSVHSRGYSGSPADYVYNEIGPYTSQLLTSKNMTFYIRLHSYMQQGDSVVIQFSNRSYEIGLLKPINTTKSSSCPFKTNSDYVNNCYLYWENPSLDDETCSSLPSPIYCKKSKSSYRHCYNHATDTCDGFNDCPKGDDEENCGESEFHWFAANVLAALILILVGWGCGCKRHGYQRSVREYRRHCCSMQCLDVYGCSPDCLSTLYTKCSQACSRVRPCGRVSSSGSGDQSPVSGSGSGPVTASPRHYAPHMPVVSISAGVDARMQHSHLIQAAAILNRPATSRGNDVTARRDVTTRYDVTTRWDAQPPGVAAGCTFPLHALQLPLPHSNRAVTSSTTSCTTTTSSAVTSSSSNGLPTYEQVRLADMGLYVNLPESAQGSRVNLLQGQSVNVQLEAEPPPAYSDVITTPPEEASPAPPTYASVLQMTPDV